MAKGSKNHTHKYHLVSMNDQKVWACALGDCTHYMPKHLEMMVPGKKSICWSCNSEMVLDATNMQKDKPLCDDCSPSHASILDLVDQLEDGITSKKTIMEILGAKDK